MFSFFRPDPSPPAFDLADSVSRLQARGAFPEVPAREVPFWDLPAVLVILLFVVALILVVHQGYHRWSAAGSAVGPTPPDLLFPPSPLPHVTTTEVATQTTENLIETVVEYSSDSTSFDGSYSAIALPPTPPADPPVLGNYATTFVNTPWGYIFAGGAVFAGLLWASPLLWRRRSLLDRPGRTLLQLYFLPLVMLGGGATSVVVTYAGGVMLGWLAPPGVLLHEFWVYFADTYLPGFRGGNFRALSLFVDLTDLLAGSRADRQEVSDLFFQLTFFAFCPGKFFRRTVAVAVFLVVAEHAVTVLTVENDLEQALRLARACQEFQAELLRLAEERSAHWADRLPGDPAERMKLVRAHELLLTGQRIDYGAALTSVRLFEHAQDLLANYPVPRRPASLLERGAAQVVRLWEWTK